ncbi:uncharacterized protein BT62DRAFT_1003104 [Guyanagaster necrorhizus]|uniref:Uncharacterized protein n=1 Tax=Guyanagaster necrorhizus TaxID=856835 RepID=A0A9P7VWS2_9AGAR|nr:uncharacterized protein BT62DRAFT_1003104 [Guyanagaster necrorhizus MCA 3950]KAG7448389.1 hypothetical protein BT62DRAFT_1003104 [Guyanagaster necrorhizus MCA 3950]
MESSNMGKRMTDILATFRYFFALSRTRTYAFAIHCVAASNVLAALSSTECSNYGDDASDLTDSFGSSRRVISRNPPCYWYADPPQLIFISAVYSASPHLSTATAGYVRSLTLRKRFIKQSLVAHVTLHRLSLRNRCHRLSGPGSKSVVLDARMGPPSPTVAGPAPILTYGTYAC